MLSEAIRGRQEEDGKTGTSRWDFKMGLRTKTRIGEDQEGTGDEDVDADMDTELSCST